MAKLHWINFLLLLSLVLIFTISAHSTVEASTAMGQPKTLSRQGAKMAARLCILSVDEFHSLLEVSLSGQSPTSMKPVDGPAGYLASGYIHSLHEVSLPAQNIHLMEPVDGPAGYLSSGFIHSLHDVSLTAQNIYVLEPVDGPVGYLTTGYLHTPHEVSVPAQDIYAMETAEGPQSDESGLAALSGCR